MRSNRETLLCRYFYDPLDRLTTCTPSKEASTQRFYLKDRLATEIQGTVQRSIVQHEDHLLAQQTRQSGKAETAMLATDQQRSVLNVLATVRPNLLAYTPYGHRPTENGLLSLLGFNGERSDPVTGHYLLGNGYRAFNPVLMRFNSPDSWSPFGVGGLNAYAYCEGSPINRWDSTGHNWKFVRANLNKIASMSKPVQSTRAPHKSRSGPMKNIHRVGEGAISFEDVYKGGRRLNFFAHGSKPLPGQSSEIGVNGVRWGAKRLYSEAQKQGIDFDQFDSVRVLACYSGNGGENSFAANLGRLTKKQTKGYIGTVRNWQNTFDPREQIDAYYKKFKNEANQFYNEDYPDINLSIYKYNPFDPRGQTHDYFTYNFLSIRFSQ
jgi:RHS repeat-associated protein